MESAAAAAATAGDGGPGTRGGSGGPLGAREAATGVGGGGELAEGVDVGPPAIAGVARNDAAKATARSGGARKRCTCKSQQDCGTSLR